MNTIEDRLRDAYRAATETIQTIPDLPSERAPQRTRASSRRIRILVPLSAAAAVIAVVTGLVLSGSLLGVGHRQPSTPPSLGAGVPTFYVSSYGSSSLRVFVAATGREVGRVRGPKGVLLTGQVAALTGDRTFLTAGYPGSLRTDLVPPGQCITHVYEFRLNNAGQPGPLVQLPVTVTGHVSGLSATPDGRMIAYATGLSCQPIAGSWEEIGVINLTTHQARSWPLRLPCTPVPTCTKTGFSFIHSLALSADGQQLVFSETLYLGSGPTTILARVLPTNAPPGSYDQRSTVVPRSSGTFWAALSPDAQSVYSCSFPTLGLLGGGRTTGGVTYYADSLATGRQQLLATWPPQHDPICGGSLDTTGRYLLIELLNDPVTRCSGSGTNRASQSPAIQPAPWQPGCRTSQTARLILADLQTGQLRNLPVGSRTPVSDLPQGTIAW